MPPRLALAVPVPAKHGNLHPASSSHGFGSTHGSRSRSSLAAFAQRRHSPNLAYSRRDHRDGAFCVFVIRVRDQHVVPWYLHASSAPGSDWINVTTTFTRTLKSQVGARREAHFAALGVVRTDQRRCTVRSHRRSIRREVNHPSMRPHRPPTPTTPAFASV